MPRSAHMIQLAAAALLALGVVMVTSASMRIAEVPLDAVGLLTSRPVIYAGLALAAMLVAARINVRELYRTRSLLNPLFVVVLGSLVLLGLTHAPGVGVEVNGARRWLQLGSGNVLRFQPSELVKWTLLLALSWWGGKRRGAMPHFFDGLLPPLLLVGLACALIVTEDLGTAVLVGGVALIVLVAAGARVWQLALLAPLPILAVYHFLTSSPFRMARLSAFLNPWAEPLGSGYHPIQSMLAIAMGHVTGRGLGNGIQKFGYLPEDTTDFVFAVICEELGLFGAGLVVTLYLVILVGGLAVIRDCRDAFGQLLALGVVAMLGLQALLNLAVVTVLVPTKGIALPLISYGGTGWVLTAFALGLVAALDNANHLERTADLPDADAQADALDEPDAEPAIDPSKPGSPVPA